MNKITQRGVVMVGALVSASGAMAATAPDLSGLTAAVDFSSVLTGVVAIGVAVAGVYVLIRGVMSMPD